MLTKISDLAMKTAAVLSLFALLAESPAAQQPGAKTQVESEKNQSLTKSSVHKIVEPGSDAAETEIIGTIKPLLEKLTAEDKFSGSVLIAKDGKVIFKNAYGFANKTFQVPNRIDTKFNLASMGKIFTATAVLQLVAQNKISLEDTIDKYLPDYPNREAARKIKIHHLLTHTSGVSDFFNRQFQDAQKSNLRQAKDFLPLFADKPLAFEPGARFSYSNSGFIVLGLIVEKVSGKTYADYIAENIFRPLEMKNSGYFDVDGDEPNIAAGYTIEPTGAATSGAGKRRSNIFLHTPRGNPAGGCYSTVEDLLAFAEALRKNKILDKEFTELLTAGKVNTYRSPGEQYAYGFQVWQSQKQKVYGHGGGFPGIHSRLDIYFDSGYTVIILSNYDPPAARIVADEIRRIIAEFDK